MTAPQRKGTYRVSKAFRFRGRNFEPDMVFDARRLDPLPERLNRLYRDGFLELPDADEDREYRRQRLAAMGLEPEPQPEPEPEESEDDESELDEEPEADEDDESEPEQ